jgi:group I intron endonuclease
MKRFGIYGLVVQSERGEMTYIGSTAQTFEQRQYEHLSLLQRNKHHNKYLQRLWNKYGGFRFEIIEACEDKSIVAWREQWWMEHFDKDRLINTAPAFPSPMLGKIVSEETRRKQSESARIRAARPGESERRRAAALGKSPSAETRKKLSEASAKHYRTPEGRAFMSKINKGRTRTEAHRKNLSLANKGKKPSPQTIEAVRKAHLGIPVSEETKRKMSESHKKRKGRNESSSDFDR